jgi:hypothetical protein
MGESGESLVVYATIHLFEISEIMAKKCGCEQITCLQRGKNA